ncbi:30S ribosomal protein S12 methylthiotransferase RimO [Tyzzerella sp. OttesenSCG-928-J15]|nr:30S ribosomal protein S12 methylthiotransferase RimO [Tyzzerella sp. OttesenSCG-928-J15]
MKKTDENKNTKISFISLGCDKNLVDSEVMLGIINKEGYVITNDEAQADVIIVNTCGFILDATEEGIENVISAGEYKTKGNCKALIVTGCMAQRYKDDIFNEMPEVDAVVGTGDYVKIGQVIEETLGGKKVKMVTDINNLINEELLENRILSTPSHYAYLKIAEGCDSHCTYCTIPSLRGKYRSRKLESLVREASNLCASGIKELILVAQDTALYGKDIYGRQELPKLLKALSEIEELEWIRLLYCYPENITDGIIAEIRDNPKVCHYIDMPIQSGDDEILKRMGRKSSGGELKEIIAKLRGEVPDIVLRTTLISGFPGESDEQFNNTLKLIEDIRFDKLGVFAYSPEDGTPAAKMPNQIDDDIKEQRKDYILEVQKKISAEICEAKVGKVYKVMVEGKLPEEGVYCARTYGDAAEIDGMVFFESNDDIMAGEFRNVLITAASDYDLTGVLTDEFAQ